MCTNPKIPMKCLTMFNKIIIIKNKLVAIEIQITCGPYKQEKRLIPYIALQPSDTVLPFTFK